MMRSQRDNLRILEEASKIFVVFRARLDSGIDVVTLTESYATELTASDYGLALIERCIGRFSQGLVTGRNNAFAPTIAELFAELARLKDADDEHAKRMAPRLPPPPLTNDRDRMTPEQIALSNARIDKMASTLRNSGIHPDTVALQMRRAEFMSRLRERQTQRILDQAARSGRDPYDGSGTFPISDELLAITTKPPAEHDE
jgi:hypothetical protein